MRNRLSTMHTLAMTWLLVAVVCMAQLAAGMAGAGATWAAGEFAQKNATGPVQAIEPGPARHFQAEGSGEQTEPEVATATGESAPLSGGLRSRASAVAAAELADKDRRAHGIRAPPTHFSNV